MTNSVEEKITRFQVIQEMIARQHVYIPVDYSGTIDPDKAIMNEADGYVKIMADRFGPFDPNVFFHPETRRIVFVVKEPYHIGEILNGYAGSDKVTDYAGLDWHALGEDARIYQNVAHCAFEVLTGRTMDRRSEYDQELAVKFLNENCCIINSNFFPLIAQPGHSSKSSNNNLIYKWAQINKSVISEIIDLCDPEIVIGGSTLTHFAEVSDAHAGTLFNDNVRIINTDRVHKEMMKKDGIIYYNDRHVFINAHHPSYSRFISQISVIHRIIDGWTTDDLPAWDK